MNKEILIRILQVTVIFVLLLVFLFLLFGINVFTSGGVSKLPSILSIVVLFWTFYFSFGWKWPLIKYIVFKENLNGTWFGAYTAKNQINGDEFAGEIAVIIRQNFLMVNVKSYTINYVNHSYGEALNYDNKSDTHQLIYLYSQNEFKPTDDNVRKGTSELQLHYNLESEELFGNFWTNHNSQGHLNLSKVSKKQAKSFNEALTFSEK
jgi:hypothetical protein